METRRNDIYARIHKGIRRALFEFSIQIATTEPQDRNQLSDLVVKGSEVIEFLELHAEIEERFQLPLLHKIDPELTIEDHLEHHRLEKMVTRMRQKMSGILISDEVEEEIYRLYLLVNEFIGNYLLHMHHEEEKTAEGFLKYFTREDFEKMVNSINAFTSPNQKKLAMKYVLPSISEKERTEFQLKMQK